MVGLLYQLSLQVPQDAISLAIYHATAYMHVFHFDCFSILCCFGKAPAMVG